MQDIILNSNFYLSTTTISDINSYLNAFREEFSKNVHAKKFSNGCLIVEPIGSTYVKFIGQSKIILTLCNST